ncbi:MAG: Rid family hydrolase [Acidobacteriota bacterium]
MKKRTTIRISMGTFGVLGALMLFSACTPAVENAGESEAPAAPEMTKIAVADPSKVEVASINWGLKVRDFSELFLLSGYGATDSEGNVQFPGDAAAQAEFILGRIQAMIENNGYSKENIIRYETTVTQKVPPEQFAGIRQATSGFMSDITVKPTAGTFRVVQALGNPEMLIELDFWLAQ